MRAPRRRWWATWIRPDTPRWWFEALALVTTCYALLTLLVMAGSWFTDFDSYVYDLHLVPIGSPWRLPVQWWVFLGQRAPAMIIAGVFTLWCVYRRRRITPLITYGLAGFGFVVSVLAMKFLTGRVAPRYTDVAHTVWDGGNIFPSGHVTGTVVMYGVIAILASQAWRRTMTIVTIVLAVTVGAGTAALNLHWASDVFGGWLNGALVLLIAWAITPHVERLLTDAWRRLRDWHRHTPPPLPFDTAALREMPTAPRR